MYRNSSNFRIRNNFFFRKNQIWIRISLYFELNITLVNKIIGMYKKNLKLL